MPQAKTISQIRNNLLRPALTSNYEVSIAFPRTEKFKTVLSNVFGYSKAKGDQDQLILQCSEASLPGSQLATSEIRNDFTGVTERHAYRRIFDDRIDLTFYCDAQNYLPIRIFETWIAYITGEQYGPTNLSDSSDVRNPRAENYFYRMKYPDGDDGYTASGLTVTKFERDYESKLVYEFIKSYPLAINSMPITYEGSNLLKCNVSMTYIRYIIKGLTGRQGPAPTEEVSIHRNGSERWTGKRSDIAEENTVQEGSFNITNSATSAKRQVEAQLHLDQSKYGNTWPAGGSSVTGSGKGRDANRHFVEGTNEPISTAKKKRKWWQVF